MFGKRIDFLYSKQVNQHPIVGVKHPMGCLESESKCHGLDFGFRETDYHKKKPLVFSDLEVPYISPAWFQALPAQKSLAAAKKTDPKSDFRQVLFLDCKNPNRKNQSYDLDGTLSDLPS